MITKYVIPVYYKTKEYEIENSLRHRYSSKRLVDIDRARCCLISSIFMCLPENIVNDTTDIIKISKLKNHLYHLINDGVFLDNSENYLGSPGDKKIKYLVKSDITSAFLRSLEDDLACAYTITYIFE